MPKSYRCTILAAVGWLIVGASEPEHARNDPKRAYQVKFVQPAAAPTFRPTRKSVDASVYRAPCQQPQVHDPCDLEAQWKAANAARDAADWSWWQMVFNGVGLAGLLYSLLLTRRATKVAVDATKDADKALAVAERNAASAAELARISSENSRRELRAYLDFDGVKFLRSSTSRQQQFHTKTGVRIRLKNYGRTPAYDVNAMISYEIKDPAGLVHMAMKGEPKDFAMIAPSDHATSNGYFDIPDQVWDFIKVKPGAFTCRINGSYKDAFDTVHTFATDFESNGIDEPFGFITGTRHTT